MATHKVIITAALSGSGTYKQQNPFTPYTPAEFADEANKAYLSGAAMVHVHARQDDGVPTLDLTRIRDTYDAIKQKCPDLIVNLSSAVGMGKTPEQRISQIVEIKPEMASLNTSPASPLKFHYLRRRTG